MDPSNPFLISLTRIIATDFSRPLCHPMQYDSVPCLSLSGFPYVLGSTRKGFPCGSHFNLFGTFSDRNECGAWLHVPFMRPTLYFARIAVLSSYARTTQIGVLLGSNRVVRCAHLECSRTLTLHQEIGVPQDEPRNSAYIHRSCR